MVRIYRGGRTHRQGVAMILVLFAVAVAMVLSLAFATSQSTSNGVTSNAYSHTRARVIAESGINLALSEINRNSDWRNTFTNGVWVDGQAFADGTFTITGEDGEDTDGDGVVDGDGDLTDDASDKVTLTVVGMFNGVTHRVRTVLTPGEVALGPINVLMVVVDVDSLTDDEESRKDMIEGWGWTVNLIAASSSSDDYNTAMAALPKQCGTVVTSTGRSVEQHQPIRPEGARRQYVPARRLPARCIVRRHFQRSPAHVSVATPRTTVARRSETSRADRKRTPPSSGHLRRVDDG